MVVFSYMVLVGMFYANGRTESPKSIFKRSINLTRSLYEKNNKFVEIFKRGEKKRSMIYRNDQRIEQMLPIDDAN